MKIQQFLKEVTSREIDENHSLLLKSHPLQWIEAEIPVPVWKVEYKYKLRDSKEKQHIKYIISPDGDAGEVEHKFNIWIERYNIEHPYRALSNVEILDIEFLEGVVLELT